MCVQLALHPSLLGNYGNKLDTNAPPQASTTQPTNPVYDGNAFYFLPWMDTKPCVVVDSMWEDCTYRIEALNMLLFTLDRLVSIFMSIPPYTSTVVGGFNAGVWSFHAHTCNYCIQS